VKRWARSGGSVLIYQVGLIPFFLAAGEFLPRIQALQDSTHFLDPYFISAPSRIAERLLDLFTGRHGNVLIWPYMWSTLSAAVAGTVIGMSLGAFFGLILSNFALISRVLRPFIIAANATPRIALIPIVVILFGATFQATLIVSIMVVFFVAFFNAYEGGLTVPTAAIQSARLLGAGDWEVLRFIRLPYVLAWTFAALPLGITFAVISVVTAEILTGYPGLGRLLSTAMVTAEANLTFSVVIILAALGLTIVTLADALKRRVLHWWAVG